MRDLAHLLHQHLATRELAPAVGDGHGGLSFRAGKDLVLRASMTDEEGLELCANPGYLSQAQLRALAEDEDAQHDEDPGLLTQWETPGAVWRLRADLRGGVVMLSQTVQEMPQDADSFDSALEQMREACAEWTAYFEEQHDDALANVIPDSIRDPWRGMDCGSGPQ